MVVIPWLGHVIEAASLILFGWCWLEARAQRRGLHVELGIAVLYGWLLETLDMWIFGTYHYGPLTWWWVGHVPVYIPLLWATIIHSFMALSDQSGLPSWARPFLDGVLAVLIDLAIDAIAIRLGLWQWRIPLNEGWFGVPAGNLCAWMWVAAWYGGVTRLVRRRIEECSEPRWHRWLVPPFAYTGLFGSLFLIGTSGQWLGLTEQNERLWLFAGHLAVFLAVVVAAARRAPALRSGPAILRSLVWNRWLMHGSFLILLVASGAWRVTPWLLAVSGLSLAAEGWAQRFRVVEDERGKPSVACG